MERSFHGGWTRSFHSGWTRSFHGVWTRSFHGVWVRQFLFTVAVSSLVCASRWLLRGEEFCGPRLFATRALPRATSPTRATGTKPTTFGRCHTTEHAFPPTTRYPPNSDPQLVSLHGCEGQIKTLGFLFFLCVCLRVGPSLSRTEEVFLLIVNISLLAYSCQVLPLSLFYC